MAANKFATLIHRNTNNMTLILVYALLEWVLIILLLLNSIFSYLIVEFASYFGLKPPCPWCSRIDHFLNPKKGKEFHKDLLCENHSAEIYHHLGGGGCKNGRSASGEEECSKEEYESIGNVLPQHLEFFLGHDGFHLIPIELIDSGFNESTKLVLLETMELEETHEQPEQKTPEEASAELEEELLQMPLNEAEAEAEADVSIGTEIPDLDITHEISVTVQDSDQSESETIELKPISVELTDPHHHLFPIDEENNNLAEEEEEEEKLQKKGDESLDGSVVSELEGIDGISSVEKLKAALRAERKTLQALYKDLEEERSASAVATNETMAMINRLQEEKAAMQMEALQYQRMMDEQSEYDQEALQLLNELMTKREREKQELEKSLEVYRKRVNEYEAKEKTRRARRSSCGSSSYAGESDSLSIDLDRENENQNAPVEDVLNLEESLANFEDERVQILEQLKVLEEKLFSLDDEENGAQVKMLIPFDAENSYHIDEEQEEETDVSCENEYEKKRVVIEDEIDHLYERLQALEADREFLKHCISSLQKGDKGMDLLEEILQHLRDLRDVELRAKNVNMFDSPELKKVMTVEDHINFEI